VNGISAAWNATWSAISGYVSQVWSGIVSAVSGFVSSVQQNVQNVLTTIGRIGSDILNNVSNFGSLLLNAGRDLINGLTQGITNASGAVVETIKGIASNALGAIKDFFGIKSPSRVMRDQVGKQLGAGLAIGIEASIGAVLKATDKLAKAAVPDIADIMIPAVKTASVTSQSMSRVSAPTPLSRETVTGTTYRSGYGENLGNAPTGPVTNVNFQVNPSQGLSETQIGEAAMEQLYWKLSTSL
jgi:phage-related protein